MNQETIVVGAVSVLLVGWYVAAHLYNRHRGRRIRRWLEDGLHVLGGEVDAGWIGSPASGARLTIRRARPPFRRLEITLLLANREIPLLWLFDHLRGKRDRAIIRGTLRSPRRGEVWVRSTGRPDRQEEPWKWEHGPHGLKIGYLGRDGPRLLLALSPWLKAYGAHLRRLHWRKQDPHIELQLEIAELLVTKSEMLFTQLSTALDADNQA